MQIYPISWSKIWLDGFYKKVRKSWKFYVFLALILFHFVHLRYLSLPGASSNFLVFLHNLKCFWFEFSCQFFHCCVISSWVFIRLIANFLDVILSCLDRIWRYLLNCLCWSLLVCVFSSFLLLIVSKVSYFSSGFPGLSRKSVVVEYCLRSLVCNF